MNFSHEALTLCVRVVDLHVNDGTFSSSEREILQTIRTQLLRLAQQAHQQRSCQKAFPYKLRRARGFNY